MNRFLFLWHLDNHPPCALGKLFVFYQTLQIVISVPCICGPLADGQSLPIFFGQCCFPIFGLFYCVKLSDVIPLEISFQLQLLVCSLCCMSPVPAAFILPLLWGGQPVNTLAGAHCKEMKISLNSLTEFLNVLFHCSALQHSSLWFLSLLYQYL